MHIGIFVIPLLKELLKSLCAYWLLKKIAYMINPNENLILINGQIKTLEISSIQYETKGVCVVVFKNSSKHFHYRSNSITWLKNPTELDAQNYQIRRNGFLCENIKRLLVFSHYLSCYYHIEYLSGRMEDYTSSELDIRKSCLQDNVSKDLFCYFKDVSKANSLLSEEGVSLLANQYENISFIPTDMVIAPYLNPSQNGIKKRHLNHLIFPFGCNNSQIKAVESAFDSQLSVIQGPPGTGKTQTILNIIANVLIQKQSVLVVSNNNSATANVAEKMMKYELDFLVASLGCSENKASFVEAQSLGRKYPESIKTWECKETRTREFYNGIDNSVSRIRELFGKQERLAMLQQNLSAIEIEWQHFKKEVGDIELVDESINSFISLKLLNEIQNITEGHKFTLWEKISHWIKNLIYRYYYKIDSSLLEDETGDRIQKLQAIFYCQKIKEIKEEIVQLGNELKNSDLKMLTKSLEDASMKLLKDCLYQKYANKEHPYIVTSQSLYSDATRVIDEFPVVLSTTFSARSSIRNAEYDFLIMDEASQVSVETGVLALTCARNAVIVGDTLQLSNVVTTDDAIKLEEIAKRYEINEGYRCDKKSFLQSVIDVLLAVPQTLLREHYRCAPDIINFCNQKFYGGQLVIMTKNDNNEDSIFAVKTAKGIHCHSHVNQREIEVISREILPKLSCPASEIGIIAPYNNQVDQIKAVVDPKIDVATVHKFQGREKDVIIMSITDDQISTFADDPNLLNVAVSRAKKRFCLVVSGNNQTAGNVVDLMGYIEYHHGRVENSRIHSIFDMLYKENEVARSEYLKSHQRISEYDSENLTHVLIKEVLATQAKYSCLDVLCHYPLSLLIHDYSPLTKEEKLYACNRLTHIDFLIYNRVSKSPVFAIEVDGWTFHHEGTEQAYRDKLKNQILPQYGIPLLRLSTTGSNEKEVIEDKLAELLG